MREKVIVDERDCWLELESRIAIAKANGYDHFEMSNDFAETIVKFLKELDELKD